MRIEELDMTLRTWPGTTKYIGHARTADGRSVTVGVEGGRAMDVTETPGSWLVTLLQGPVSVEGDWHPTIAESYEQAVLEALEGAPKLARTIADIARQVRQRRRHADEQAERDAGVTPIADMHPIVDRGGWNL